MVTRRRSAAERSARRHSSRQRSRLGEDFWRRGQGWSRRETSDGLRVDADVLAGFNATSAVGHLINMACAPRRGRVEGSFAGKQTSTSTAAPRFPFKKTSVINKTTGGDRGHRRASLHLQHHRRAEAEDLARLYSAPPLQRHGPRAGRRGDSSATWPRSLPQSSSPSLIKDRETIPADVTRNGRAHVSFTLSTIDSSGLRWSRRAPRLIAAPHPPQQFAAPRHQAGSQATFPARPNSAASPVSYHRLNNTSQPNTAHHD